MDLRVISGGGNYSAGLRGYLKEIGPVIGLIGPIGPIISETG